MNLPFQSEDKVLVNGKHAEVKMLKDIGGGHFEVGVVYTEDKRFDTVIYPFTEIQKIDSPIESAKKLKFDPSWKYDLATDALRFKHAYLYDKILPAHEQRFLLADDPGLGKTIMAGMVIKELHARGRANRVLILNTLRSNMGIKSMNYTLSSKNIKRRSRNKNCK